MRRDEFDWFPQSLSKLVFCVRTDTVRFDAWLVRVGFTEEELAKFVEFGQGFMSISPALRELEARLLGAKLKHGEHPVLTMCAMNAAVVQDPAGNRKFTKAKSSGRIDGMVSLAMAVAAMPQEQAASVSEYKIFFV